MGDHVCMNQYVNAQDIHVLSWKIVNSKFTKLLFYPLKTVSFREMRNSTLQKDEKFNKFVLLFFFYQRAAVTYIEGQIPPRRRKGTIS